MVENLQFFTINFHNEILRKIFRIIFKKFHKNFKIILATKQNHGAFQKSPVIPTFTTHIS